MAQNFYSGQQLQPEVLTIVYMVESMLRGRRSTAFALAGPQTDERYAAHRSELNSAALGIGRHVAGLADPFNGHIDEFPISHVQRSDGWIKTTWNNMSDPGAFAAAGAEEQEGGEAPPLAGADVVVCLMG